MRLLSFLLFLSIVMPFAANAQSDVESVPVREGLYMLVSPKGGNVLVSAGSDGVFIFDDQLDGRSPVIMDAIKKISDKDVKFIVNSHYHFDHSGGNEFFGEKGAVIVTHDNVRKRLSTKQFITYFDREMLPLSKSGLPKVTFSDAVTLYYNDSTIEIIHFPAAHTDGDAAAYFVEANVIVAGDIVFNGMYPFIDTEHGGSAKGVIAALDRFIAMADDNTVIVPGHGGLMNKADLTGYTEMLKTIVSAVEQAVQAGKTLEQTFADKPTQDFDGLMEAGIVGPDAFVTILYESIKSQNGG